MAIVTLTFTEKGQRTVDGIPEFVEITSSSAAIIFYTLDGTLPSMMSEQYDGYAIKIPTDSSSVTLSAIAYFMDGYGNLVPSSVFSEEYRTDGTFGDRIRRFDFEGVVYIYPGGLDIPYWYDSDGNAKVFIDIPIEEFEKELIPSERNADGSIRNDVRGGIIEKQYWTETSSTRDDDFVPFSSPDSETFDPSALYIVIDGRNRDPDDVQLINGPYMSLRDSERNFGGIDFISTDGSNYTSGSLVKSHYNRAKGIAVFYYYDSNANRWIKSIQELPRVDRRLLRNSIVTNPVVFKWNNFGRHQAI